MRTMKRALFVFSAVVVLGGQGCSSSTSPNERPAAMLPTIPSPSAPPSPAGRGEWNRLGADRRGPASI